MNVILESLGDPVWQVFMLAFHMLNQGARHDLFPRTQANIFVATRERAVGPRISLGLRYGIARQSC